ncbi:hypothetical protein F53441_12249 [Fusarium austroafricanum]|uniref:Uncharacterized protein n=1 Tax=Fusarium austroafricanum TaxID=2364996 RepID=A0A8H4JYZ8_9HYPO|nr:hypothetical protein F53441_12249 [Fusarium austroafricanum]
MYEVKKGSLQILPDPVLPFTEASGSLGAANPSRPSQSRQLSANRVRFDVPLEPVQRHTTDTTFAEMSRRSSDTPRRNLSYAQRPVADINYHSQAATQKKYRRRATTILEYCDENPHLLPQLPFTWHHGWKRWRPFVFALLIFVDASVIPITLYYGMRYAGEVEGWIIFAIVATIWGGPTYLEFDISILYCLGGVLLLITLYHYMGWVAPFRISSTAKGEKVLPGVYYFIEDIVAVNAGSGRPYREALVARYKASPRFRRMIYMQSWFWPIPALNLAIPLTVISVIPQVPVTVAYGVAWTVPFLWATIWGIITIQWCKRDIARERGEWEAGI